MLEESRLKQLHELIDSYSKEELIWINGYLSGIWPTGKLTELLTLRPHVKTMPTKDQFS
jgi:hypothetical protein